MNPSIYVATSIRNAAMARDVAERYHRTLGGVTSTWYARPLAASDAALSNDECVALAKRCRDEIALADVVLYLEHPRAVGAQAEAFHAWCSGKRVLCVGASEHASALIRGAAWVGSVADAFEALEEMGRAAGGAR